MPTIYNLATGEALECASVDMREILEASPDLYSATPQAVEIQPDVQPIEPEPKAGGSKKAAE